MSEIERASSEDLRRELRRTIHELNNLLAAILVQSEAIAADPGTVPDRVRGRAESILHSALDATGALARCRRQILPHGT